MNTFFVQNLFGNTNLTELLTLQYYLAKYLHFSYKEMNEMPIHEFQFFWNKLLDENKEEQEEQE